MPVVAGESSAFQDMAVRSYLKPLSILQRVLRRVHDGIPLVVIFRLEPDGIEGDGNVFLPHSKEAADADDQCDNLAVAIDQNIRDLADLGVGRIIDILLVPMRNGRARWPECWAIP